MMNRNDYTETRNNFEELYNRANINEESSQEDIENAAEYYGVEENEDRYELIDNIRNALLENVLSYEVRTNIDVLLTFGGPTTFIRFPVMRNGEEWWELAGNASYHSSNNEGHTMQVVELTEEESENLFEIYGVAYTSNN